MSITFIKWIYKKTVYVGGNQRQLSFAFSLYIFVVLSSVTKFLGLGLAMSNAVKYK